MSKSDLEISAKYWEAEAEKARKRAKEELKRAKRYKRFAKDDRDEIKFQKESK
jgi:hypothetical protein